VVVVVHSWNLVDRTIAAVVHSLVVVVDRMTAVVVAVARKGQGGVIVAVERIHFQSNKAAEGGAAVAVVFRHVRNHHRLSFRGGGCDHDGDPSSLNFGYRGEESSSCAIVSNM
jgi:hypothetical protein